MAPHPSHLLIGVGNRLRGDDGAGYRLAELLAAEPHPTAAPWQVLAVQQLTPELAAAIAIANAVLFVDAWHPNTPQPPRPVLELKDTPRQDHALHQRLSHQCSPGQLLDRQLGHGEALSPSTAQAVAAGLRLVRQWRPSHA
jgi:hydrogenase maturation protease